MCGVWACFEMLQSRMPSIAINRSMDNQITYNLQFQFEKCEELITQRETRKGLISFSFSFSRMMVSDESERRATRNNNTAKTNNQGNPPLLLHLPIANMANFFSLDDSFPVIPGSDLLFSPAALAAPLPPTPVETAKNNAARKRQREAEEKASNKTSTELEQQLSSDNPDHIVEALNFLLQKSADHDLNFALGRDGEKVIDALVLLFDETIGWVHGNSKWVLNESYGDNDEDWSLKPSAKTWECNASPCINPDGFMEKLEWQSFCATRFAPASLNTSLAPSHVPSYNMRNIENDREGIKMLEIIIMILRNLSYGKSMSNSCPFFSNGIDAHSYPRIYHLRG